MCVWVCECVCGCVGVCERERERERERDVKNERENNINWKDSVINFMLKEIERQRMSERVIIVCDMLVCWCERECVRM